MKELRPVNSPKITDLIIEQIREMILCGHLKPSERLPSERELVERFKASRIAVREALKSLEASGLITIKPGSGVYVAHADGKKMSDSLYSILKIKNISLNEITEGRVMFEPHVAHLAAERVNDEDISLLEENIEKTASVLDSHTHSTNENIEFHALVADCVHNALISLTMRTMLEVARVMTLESHDNREERIDISIKSYEQHKLILKALKNRDPEKSYKLMLEHIVDVQKALIKAMPGR